MPGFQQLAQASQVLGITLIHANGIQKRMSFYIEVWTDPQEAASRISRTHFQVSGECSLSEEKVEIDWYGDEDWVVVQVVEFGGPGKEKPLGEIRLRKSAVEKYAREAMSESGLGAGARVFAVKKLEEWMVKIRKRRAKDPAPANTLFSWMMSKGQERVGLGVGMSEEEAINLRSENKRLQSALKDAQSGKISAYDASASTNAFDLEGAMAHQPTIMSLVLKFELLPRKSETQFDTTMFKSSSFHDTA